MSGVNYGKVGTVSWAKKRCMDFTPKPVEGP